MNNLRKYQKDCLYRLFCILKTKVTFRTRHKFKTTTNIHNKIANTKISQQCPKTIEVLTIYPYIGDAFNPLHH